MSFTLGSITLPEPQNFVRGYTETGSTQTTLNGRTVKDIRNRKEVFTLVYQLLSATEVAQILGEYDLQVVRDFTVNETNLTIAATPVHIEVIDRSFIKGEDRMEGLTLILTEVI